MYEIHQMRKDYVGENKFQMKILTSKHEATDYPLLLKDFDDEGYGTNAYELNQKENG